MEKHSDFVHLHVHSQYSLLDGACRLQDLVAAAKRHKMPALALTDHGNLFGLIEFYDACMKGGVKPILGVETYVAPVSRLDKEAKGISDASFHLILLAKDEEGYRNLMKLISIAHMEGFYYRPRIDKEVLAKHSKGLMCLSSCLQGEVSYWFNRGEDEKAAKAAAEYSQIFPKGDFYLEIQDHGIGDQRKIIPKMLELGKRMELPVVATNDMHYIEKAQAHAHEALLCIQTQTTLDDPKRFKFETDEFYFKSPEEMRAIFGEVKQALLNTREVAEKANVELEFGKLHLPQFHPPAGKTQDQHLRELVEAGLKRCYPAADKRVRDRVEHELKIITQTGFTSYFLITWDFVQYAKSKGIPVGPGRGSAAGSVVSYCLGITDLDPIEHDLIFERFLNPDRISMPDIDIDFCYERRGEVIDYVSQKYGKGNVAQVITFGTMQAKAVVRDVSRAMGFSYPEADRIAKMIPFELGMTLRKAMEMVPELKRLAAEDERVKQLMETSMALEGLTRHASTHAAGVVIADGDLTDYVPLFKTSEDQVATGYAMEALEKIGLLKMDFLGLRTLTVLHEAAGLIRRHRGIEFDGDRIPLDDAATYAMLTKGECTGVFQLESSGMRDLVRRLKPERFQDLIALVALFRPGPLGSGMVDDFIKRRHGQLKVTYDHPSLEPILKDTYGVCLAGETMIEDVSTGIRYRLDELTAAQKISIQGVDKDYRPAAAPVVHVMDNGVRSVCEVSLHSGRRIKMTSDHLVLTESGWKAIGELRPGDYIAAPRSLFRQEQDYDKQRLRALAYLIADGDISNKSGVHFISVEPELIRDFENCLASFELVDSYQISQVRGVSRVVVRKPATHQATYHTPNGLLAFLREHGLKDKHAGLRSWEKFVPPFVFTLNADCIAQFLASLWDCDGHVGKYLCHYVTTSPRLARDVQDLLLKIGIGSVVYTSRYGTKKGRLQTRYQVTVYDGEGFCKWIQPLLLSKKRFVRCISRGDTSISRKEFAEEIRSVLGKESWRSASKRLAFDRQHLLPCGMRRARIQSRAARPIAERLELTRALQMLRLRWDRIERIENAGEERVYDLEVGGIHNFVANGIIVHNCIYQEQVMRIAHEVAGFTLSEADGLRRAMGKKKPEELERAHEKFIAGCVKNKMDRRTAQKIFEKIEFFAGYAFNRSHSAAYALISYRTAYLKANFPAEFMTALLTSERDNTEKIAQYIEEARRMGLAILPPDVNASFARFTVDQGAIRYGLLGVKNVGEKAIECIVEGRNPGGAFTSLTDFCERVDGHAVNRKVLESLIKCGAFDGLKLRRSQLMAVLDSAMNTGSKRQKEKDGGQLSFFDVFGSPAAAVRENLDVPDLQEWPQEQLLGFEKQLLGFYLTGHPLAAYRSLLGFITTTTTGRLAGLKDGQEVLLGGIIAKMKVTTTKRGNERMGIVTFEDFDGSIEVVAFPKSFALMEQHLKPDALVVIRGKVSLREENPKLFADEATPLEEMWNRRARGIQIRLTEGMEHKVLESLRQTLGACPGSTPVELCVAGTGAGDGARIIVGSTLHVTPSPVLLQQLIDLVGSERISIKT